MPRLTSGQKAIQAAQRFSRLVLALNVAKDQDEHGTAKDDDRSDSSQSMLEDVLLLPMQGSIHYYLPDIVIGSPTAQATLLPPDSLLICIQETTTTSNKPELPLG